MTLLLFEQSRLDNIFDTHWTDWQDDHAVALPFTQRDTEPRWNHFPLLLYEYFPEVSLRAAQQIALASRAASMLTFLFQKEATSDSPPDQRDAAATWLQAFTQQKLADVIPNDAPFWQSFAEGYQRCQEVFERERIFLSLPLQPYSPDSFAEITEGKAALAHSTLRAFVYVAGQRAQQAALTESQRHLYTGLQLYCDVLNWKDDYVSGAFSYLLNDLLKALSFAPSNEIASRRAHLDELGPYVYYTGLAEHMLATSSDHFCRAMAAVTDLPSTSWRALLAKLFERGERLRKDLSSIRRKQTARVQTPKRQDRIASATVPASRANLEKAMDAAAHFLAQEQAADGRWGDFMLSAEESTFWVTGYVGWTLAKTQRADADLPRAARWLLHHQYPGGGWGYNGNWPLDADTIANVLLFLSGLPDIEPEAWAPALEVLLKHQRPDGGFSTFVDADDCLSRVSTEIDDVSGWMSSHPCVTAVAAFFLAQLDDGRYRPQVAKALAYMRTQQHAEGYWDAYWWTGRFYTTSRTLQAMHAMGDPQDLSPLAEAGTWLAGIQRPDGGWATAGNETGQTFDTALSLQALCVSEDRHLEAIERAVDWLLTAQLPNGSWPGAPIMRHPAPDILRPWERTEWRDSILGLNVIIPDWRRLFTTATALQALHAAATHLPLFAQGDRFGHPQLFGNVSDGENELLPPAC